MAFCNADQLLNLVHLRKQLLVLSIDEFNLALLADYFLISLLRVEILTNGCVAWGACGYNLKTVDLLVAHANFLVQQEDVLL